MSWTKAVSNIIKNQIATTIGNKLMSSFASGGSTKKLAAKLASKSRLDIDNSPTSHLSAQNDPFKVEDQVAIIYLGSKNLLKSVPVDKIKEFEKKFLDLMNVKHKKILDIIKQGKLTDDVLSTLESVAADLSSSYE